MFTKENLIDSCKNLVQSVDSHKKIRDYLAACLDDCGQVAAQLGEPREAGFDLLYRSDDLTIINFVWAPGMILFPHNHNMWAVIGIYTGREDNIFWRRTEGSQIEAAGATSMSVREAHPLGKDIIHSVTNPIEKLTGAIHIYGGDFFEEERSEWDPESLSERRYDVEKNARLFREANARFKMAAPA